MPGTPLLSSDFTYPGPPAPKPDPITTEQIEAIEQMRREGKLPPRSPESQAKYETWVQAGRPPGGPWGQGQARAAPYEPAGPPAPQTPGQGQPPGKPPPPQPPPGTAAGEIPAPATPGSQGLAPSPISTVGDFINKGVGTLSDFINRGMPQQADVAGLSPDKNKFTQQIVSGPNETLTQFTRMPALPHSTAQV